MSAPRIKPILFSAPMVRAIIEGRKTQTRRVLRPARGTTIADYTVDRGPAPGGMGRRMELPVDRLAVPYVAGDRLWVRETWAPVKDDLEEWIDYRATPRFPGESDKRAAAWDNAPDDPEAIRWRSSMFMPRSASRLTLAVTDVRVQRVQEISENDAIAEGANPYMAGHGVCSAEEARGLRAEGFPYAEDYRTGFGTLWDSLNGKRAGCSWDDNPLVVALTFTVHRANINAVLEKAAAPRPSGQKRGRQ